MTIEKAQLGNKELIYGTYEECEAYADKADSWVVRYFDHVNPSTVYKNFKYIGNDMSNPYSVSTPFNYGSKKQGNYSDSGVNLDKW